MTGESTVLFVDELSLSSLLHLLLHRRSSEAIWHFEPITPSGQRLLGICRFLRLINGKVRQFPHQISDVRDAAGESQVVVLAGYARAIGSKIRAEQVEPDPLIRAMASEWRAEKLLLYFDKLIEKEIQRECFRIGLVKWMLRTHLHVALPESVLLIRRGKWFSYLQAHAWLHGIQLIGYGRLWSLTGISKTGRTLMLIWARLPFLWRRIANRLRRLAVAARRRDLPGKPPAEEQAPASRIAIHYWHRSLSFDPATRSEFFWVHGSGIPYSEILLYGFVADGPLAAETLRPISEHGVKVLGRGPGIPNWFPTRHIFIVLVQAALKLMLAVLRRLARGQRVSPYYVRALLALAIDYAYWFDFFAANRVQVNVGTLNTSVAQVLALDALNGVSVAYQYSTSNILYPSKLLSSGENIQFVFSPVFERLWRRIDAPVDSYVHTGFIYDGAFQALRASERPAETRKQLRANGARFILCFYDENSVNRWDIAAPHDEAAHDYEYLLKWLLADPTLGIVFKPKKSKDLFQRIARVSGLIEQARRTGRCRFLTSDYVVGSVFPAEAAFAADICVGKLSGGTAATESCLAGVPTLLIDVEGFRSHPFHKWGRGKVVFDSWKQLRVAVEEYRSAPEAHPEFGDWSPGLDDFDPFQDGQASLRMGLYIRWVYEALKQGVPKQAALATAAEQYRQRWGMVVAGRT